MLVASYFCPTPCITVRILNAPDLREQPVAWSALQNSTVPFLHCEDEVTRVECFWHSLVPARAECLMTVSCYYYFYLLKGGAERHQFQGPHTIIRLSVHNQPLEEGQAHWTIHNQQINTTIVSNQEPCLFAPGQCMGLRLSCLLTHSHPRGTCCTTSCSA